MREGARACVCKQISERRKKGPLSAEQGTVPRMGMDRRGCVCMGGIAFYVVSLRSRSESRLTRLFLDVLMNK